MSDTPLDQPALREIASAATEGVRVVDHDDQVIRLGDGEIIYDRSCGSRSEWAADRNREFIAAFDPPTVLALLERVERAESVYERVEQQALGAEANLEAALKVSRERLTRAEAAEKKVAASITELDRWDTPALRRERDDNGTHGFQRLIDGTRAALDGGA